MGSRLISLPLHCREERDKAFEEAFSPLRKVSFRIRGSRTEMTGLFLLPALRDAVRLPDLPEQLRKAAAFPVKYGDAAEWCLDDQ